MCLGDIFLSEKNFCRDFYDICKRLSFCSYSDLARISVLVCRSSKNVVLFLFCQISLIYLNYVFILYVSAVHLYGQVHYGL